MPIKENPLSRLDREEHPLSRISLRQLFSKHSNHRNEDTEPQQSPNGDTEPTAPRPRIVKTSSHPVTVFSEDTIPSHQKTEVYRPPRKLQTT